jgi:hypothetical protein
MERLERVIVLRNQQVGMSLIRCAKAGAMAVHDWPCTNPAPPFVRCAILCLERALESEMDSMNGQHGNGGTPRFSGCCAVCFAVHFGIQTGSIG